MRALLNYTLPIQDGRAELANIRRLALPMPAEAARFNSFSNPLGQSPARGWFLIDRKTLNAVGLNSTYTITLASFNKTLTLKNLIIAREPQCVVPGEEDDETAVFLVEFADNRHLLADPFIGVACNKQYNVRAPGYIPDATDTNRYYATSLNAGAIWTWQTMVADLWTTCALLGSSSTLPFTPDGTPEGWKFPGVSAWDALNAVLYRLGYAVRWNPEAATNAYSIVRIGDTDTAADASLSRAQAWLIYDRQYLNVVKGNLPRTVRVCFNKRWEHYGNEQTTIKTASQWSTLTPYTVDITGPESSTDGSTVHVIWDDLPALYDPTDTLTNSSALTARAQERSDTFYRMGRGNGGFRQHKIFDGMLTGPTNVAIQPGTNIKGVTWRQDLAGIGTREPGGLVTEIFRHPYWMLRVNEHSPGPSMVCCNGSADNQAPDFSPTYPVYPHLFQKIRLTTGTADANKLYTGFVQRYNPTARTWADAEACWAREHNGLTKLTTNRIYDGRLSGHEVSSTAAPIYTIGGGTGRIALPVSGVPVAATTPSLVGELAVNIDAGCAALYVYFGTDWHETAGGGLNPQTGDYTFVAADYTKLVLFNPGDGFHTWTLPTTTPLDACWHAFVINNSAASSPGTLRINTEAGATDFGTVFVGGGGYVQSDGAGTYDAFAVEQYRFPKTVSTATYTVLASDENKLLVFTHANGCAVTLPQSTATGNFRNAFRFHLVNASAGSTTSPYGTVTVTPTTSTIDGVTYFTILPRCTAEIVADGTNYRTERGRMPAGVTEISGVNATHTVTAADHGRMLAFTGTGTMQFIELPGFGLPPGIRFSIINISSSQDAIVQYIDKNAAINIEIPTTYGYEMYSPDLPADAGTTSYAVQGIMHGGVRSFSGNQTLSRADQFRELVYSGSGHTLTLFEADSTVNPSDKQFAFCVRNIGTGLLTIARAGADVIDGSLTSYRLYPCQGIWMFSDGANWFTLTGKPCFDSGTAVPTYAATEGTPYWKTDTDQLYVNNNGSTGWTQVGGGDIGVRVRHATTDTISAGAAASYQTFVTEDYDTDTMWSGGSAKRITFTTAGKYIVMYSVKCQITGEAATGNVSTHCRLNGSGAPIVGSETSLAIPKDAASLTYVFNCAFEYNFAAADYIELGVTNSLATNSVGVTPVAIQARKVDRAG